MQAEWRIKGVYKADPQKVADEIGNDRITPQEVLELARNEDSELHKCFEWDDSVAAEKFRLKQAQMILISLVFKKSEEHEPVRVYQITSERNTYHPTQKLLVMEDEYQNLLRRAKNELEAFQRKYRTLSELEAVLEAIDAL